MRNRIGNFLERNRALAILTMFFLLFINACWDAYSYWDRKELHSVVDSRARIGIVVICHNWLRFTEAERQTVISNWKDARYPGEPCK